MDAFIQSVLQYLECKVNVQARADFHLRTYTIHNVINNTKCPASYQSQSDKQEKQKLHWIIFYNDP